MNNLKQAYEKGVEDALKQYGINSKDYDPAEDPIDYEGLKDHLEYLSVIHSKNGPSLTRNLKHLFPLINGNLQLGKDEKALFDEFHKKPITIDNLASTIRSHKARGDFSKSVDDTLNERIQHIIWRS